MAEEYLSLTHAARLSPGRPSANAVWRWCRRGLRARGADRVRLRHIRVGGRIYTRPEWLDAFFEQLAEADAAHFAEAEASLIRPRKQELSGEGCTPNQLRALEADGLR